MSLFSYIKSFFVKELEDIVAPLDRIKSNIENFVHKTEIKIEKDATKARDLLEKNKQRVESNLKAATVIKNLETLLGIKG